MLQIEDLARFLTSKSHDTEEVSQFLIENTLSNLEIIDVYYWRLDNDGKLRYIGGHFKHDLLEEIIDELDLGIDLPVTDCIRTKEVVWVNGEEEWNSNYPAMNSFKMHKDIKTMICIPIQVEGHPIACWGISSSNNLKRSPDLISLLTAVASIVALYAKNLPEFNSARQEGVSRKILSRRQNNIINLIREKLTNREIGEELGFSESTIRQETMRIYKHLNVNNRREAAAFRFIED